MAYGVPWSDRDYEPDPREVVEEAARAAGMSVGEWLNRASYGAQDRSDYRGGRPPRQQRRYEHRYARERNGSRDSGNRDSGIRDDRIARILDGAMENIEDSLRSNEERTAGALQALEQRLREMERPNARSSYGSPPDRHAASPSPESADLVRKLENKISNVVSMLESRSAQRPAPRPTSDGLTHEAIAQVVRQELRQELRQPGGPLDETIHGGRINAVEDAIRQLATKLDNAPQQRDQTQGTAFKSALEDMHGVIRTLNNTHRQDEVLESIRQLEKKLASSEAARPASSEADRAEALAQPLARIHEELNRLTQRTKSLDNLKPVDSGLLSIEKQMGSISDRIDALTDKVAAMRLNGARDLRVQKPVDAAFEELKSLILQSRAPATDSRVLESLQAMERKVEAMQRAPSELASRLDRIQLLIGEKPAAPMPKDLEPLLQTIVNRLDQVQNGPVDDRAFDKLHEEIRFLSQKIEETPRSMQIPAATDISGLERHMTQLFQQLDTLKNNMGEVAQQAASKAAADTLSNQSLKAHAAPADTAQFEKALTSMQMSQQEGERRTQQTLEALHSTLQRVVERLVDMERDMQALPAQVLPAQVLPAQVLPAQVLPAQSVSAQAPAMAPQPVILPAASVYTPQPLPQAAAPHTAPAFTPAPYPVERPAVVSRARPLQDYSLQDDVPQVPAHRAAPVPHSVPVFDPSVLPGAISAADQSFARGIDDIRADKASAPPVQDRPLPDEDMPATIADAPTKGGIAGVLAAARNAVTSRGRKNRASADDDAGGAFDATTSASFQKAPARNNLLDLPLEPGSGRPAPDLGRQAQSRPGQEPTARLQDAPILATPADPKAAFLAAARRAAQAAAEQSADVLAQSQKKGMPSLSRMLSDTTAAAKAATGKAANANGGNAKSGLTKKHAMLLGLAALIVAVGATLQFTGAKREVSVPAKETPEQTSRLDRNTGAINGQSPTTTASVATARQILPGPANDALPAPLEVPSKQTPPSTSSARDLAAREKAAREMIARTEERVTSPSTRAASPSAAFGPLDPATVGSIAPPRNSAADSGSAVPPTVSSPAQSAALPDIKARTNDPLFKFDGVRGAERLKQAAQAGDPNAFLELGNRFADGRGAPRDPKTAALWYERATEFGSAPAQYRLASMYREGRGVERNPKIALKHFQAAAEAGNARAMHNTAVLLAEGVNGSPDYAAAADWFKKAAEHGIKDSQFNLAILYARGLGTPQDLMASYAWFAAAGGQGDEDAVKKRDEVGTRLSPETLTQAKAAAATWKPRTPDPAANEVLIPAGGWDDQAKVVPPAARPKASRG